MRDEPKTSVALHCFTTLLAGVCLLLSGCGQKGPLSLPAAVPTPAASVPAK